ncbi:MAG: hypothetical protein Q4E22_01565 [Coriobacteriia bacterium]|nr:hypothetical protein [Coriobacteriia bacterium]
MTFKTFFAGIALSLFFVAFALNLILGFEGVQLIALITSLIAALSAYKVYAEGPTFKPGFRNTGAKNI